MMDYKPTVLPADESSVWTDSLPTLRSYECRIVNGYFFIPPLSFFCSSLTFVVAFPPIFIGYRLSEQRVVKSFSRPYIRTHTSFFHSSINDTLFSICTPVGVNKMPYRSAYCLEMLLNLLSCL